MCALLAVASGVAFAGFSGPAPEIDASTGIAAIALAGGGLLILRSRKRK
jgi:hypothetical protein